MEETEDFYNLNASLRGNVKNLLADYSKLKSIIDQSNTAATNLNRHLGPLTAKFSSLSSVANSILRSTLKGFANNMAHTLEDSIGKMFAGTRATGGNVSQNMPYIVGEKGPEVFMPNTAGHIVPHNHFTRKASNINVTMNIVTPDTSSFQRSQTQIISKISKALGKRLR